MAGLLQQENGEFDEEVDPTEEMYMKTLSSFKFLIQFGELSFDGKRDLFQKAST